MKAIGMISWKGGTGKTTIASNLNERATAQGLDTVVIDMDPQLNAVRYLNFRHQHSPDASPIQVFQGGMDMHSIQSIQTMLKAEKHDLMICDLPGADAFTMDRAVELMDLLLIPLSPSPFDISDTIDLITPLPGQGLANVGNPFQPSGRTEENRPDDPRAGPH